VSSANSAGQRHADAGVALVVVRPSRGEERAAADSKKTVVTPSRSLPSSASHRSSRSRSSGCARTWDARLAERRRDVVAQRAPVDLAARVERQRAHPGDLGGSIRERQRRAQSATQILGRAARRGSPERRARRRVALSLASPRSTHADRAHAGVSRDRGLDLGELDPVAEHLDLAVDAPEELDRAVVAPTRPVAGAVQPRAGQASPTGATTKRDASSPVALSSPSATPRSADDDLAGSPAAQSSPSARSTNASACAIGAADRHRTARSDPRVDRGTSRTSSSRSARTRGTSARAAPARSTASTRRGSQASPPNSTVRHARERGRHLARDRLEQRGGSGTAS
jgi:hypothetical protein